MGGHGSVKRINLFISGYLSAKIAVNKNSVFR
jgi:hypothetical protein